MPSYLHNLPVDAVVITILEPVRKGDVKTVEPGTQIVGQRNRNENILAVRIPRQRRSVAKRSYFSSNSQARSRELLKALRSRRVAGCG